MDIYIDGNYTNIRFSAAHFIPGEWKCDRIHGHDYAISAKISGELGNNSYFLDFSSAKSSLKEIADFLDHRVIIPTKNKIMKIEEKGNTISVKVRDKEYSFPTSECRLLPIMDSTAECLSSYILDKFKNSLKGKYNEIEIEVHEGPGQYARSTWKE
jgi:6-pyruvoyltetrahydropterin/6-carboxytetrahydropterin synthase